MTINPPADAAKLVERLRFGDLFPELHPVETGRHENWDIAQEIVGHHHSKASLIQVVNVLLISLAAQASQIEALTGELSMSDAAIMAVREVCAAAGCTAGFVDDCVSMVVANLTAAEAKAAKMREALRGALLVIDGEVRTAASAEKRIRRARELLDQEARP